MSDLSPIPHGGIYAPAIYAPEEELIAKSQLPPRERLESIYAGLDVEVFRLYTEPKNDEDLELNYLTSKLWRMNNLYTIIDKDGERIPFVMNVSQHRVYAAILTWYRILILKSRQQGISTFWLLCYLDDALFYEDLNIGLMAQGKTEANNLLKRVKLAWRTLDPAVKDALERIGIATDNKDEIGFTNNSTIYIAVSFRSAALQRLHVSELGKIANNFPERARELKTGTMQAIKPGNPVVIESTAEGENMFKEMWETAMGLEKLGSKDFMPIFLSWLEDPDCNSYIDEDVDDPTAKYFKEIEDELDIVLTKSQRNFWVMQKRELQDDIYQEYPSTPTEAFIAVRDGTYYARLYMKHITIGKRQVKGLYDPTLSVQVAMDLGMNDTFVLVYYQRWNKEVRIIDEYHNSGYEIKHYVDHMFASGYTITNVEIPHDGKVRELQTGKTRKAYMRSLGVTNLHQLERDGLEDGIDAVRKALQHLWIDPKCVYLIRCLKSYTKEFDDKHDVWKNKPLHNEASNGADAIRVMEMGRRVNSKKLGKVKAGRKRPDNGVIDGVAM